MKTLKTALLSLLLISHSQLIAASTFVGYELGQMSFNGFQHVAGEVGYKLDNNTSIRLAFLNVALSERHLSSGEASAVNGGNVEGLWRGAEILYDFPITKRFSVSPSVGRYDSEYSHTLLDQSIRRKSSTAGLALSYSEEGIFSWDKLYWRLSISYRHYFNPVPRTTLGDSIVRGDSGELTPALFVGYRFE